MNENLIRTEIRGPLGLIIFNRPEKRNAMNFEMLKALPGVVAEMEKAPELRVLIFRGAGESAFCAGGDITEFPGYGENREKAEEWHRVLVGAIDSVHRTELTTLAMLHGPAAGAGCEIALACDLRLAAEDAKLGITGSRLGFPIPFHNALRLVSLAGPANAKRLLYTAELADAREAFRMGLVDKVVSKEDLEAETLALAGKIAAQAPLAQRGIKKTVDGAVRGWSAEEEEASRERFVEAYLSEDFREGVRAFLEKRPPVFQGR